MPTGYLDVGGQQCVWLGADRNIGRAGGLRSSSSLQRVGGGRRERHERGAQR